MALPSSGSLSIQQINAEFGRGNDLNSYRGTVWYSGGSSGTFPTGAISISDFYGKSATSPLFTATISSHQQQLNLRSWAVANGWNQSSQATITIASGVYIWSDDINTAALTIDGSWPGGLTVINNGYIMGKGGTGGGYSYTNVSPATAYSNYGQTSGGPAVSLGVSCTIQNNSYMGGGGGGGGSCVYGFGTSQGLMGGGGAGGGYGGSEYYNNAGAFTWYYGGSGGSIGSSGANGSDMYRSGGGGRIMPGSNTTLTLTSPYGGSFTSTGGGGGNTGDAYANNVGNVTVSGQTSGGLGGSGGGTGSGVCTTGYYSYASGGGGGGGWGASGGSGKSGTNLSQNPGAAGGKCVNLNGYSITWSATGTRYGGIS